MHGLKDSCSFLDVISDLFFNPQLLHVFGDQKPQCHRQKVGGVNSLEEVGEEGETTMVWHVGDGIYKHTDDLCDHLVHSGCLLVPFQW